jgi:ABC-type Fe3+-hydroxamate transport system substrate-binding protein
MADPDGDEDVVPVSSSSLGALVISSDDDKGNKKEEGNGGCVKERRLTSPASSIEETETTTQRTFVDQMGRTVHLPLSTFPRRIVSLVPSQTELLFYLGLGDRVVGVTNFCVHPRESSCRAKTIRVGGTKTVDLEKVVALQPDLILGNKEENFQNQIECLIEKGLVVWMSDVATFHDALNMIESIGAITNTTVQAQALVDELTEAFAPLISKSVAITPQQQPDVAAASISTTTTTTTSTTNTSTPIMIITAIYLIWRNPYMAVGHGTFIDEMMRMAGLTNALPVDQRRYPVVTVAELIDMNPTVILLSSEPFHFKQYHVVELQQQLLNISSANNIMMKLVDGEIFSWYGNRLLLAPTYLSTLRDEIIDEVLQKNKINARQQPSGHQPGTASFEKDST